MIMENIGNTNLERFIEAQSDCYNQALLEIKNGKKCSHWIWYIFPQIKGLGFSYNSSYYGISSFMEAKDYLRHELLGKRLLEITASLLLHKGKDIYQIMGDVDAIKLKSSMTLFDAVLPENVFAEVLDEFYAGERCRRTMDFLAERL